MARHMRANPTEHVDLFDTTTTGTISLGAGLTSGGIQIGNVNSGHIEIRGANYNEWAGSGSWSPLMKSGGDHNNVVQTVGEGRYAREDSIVFISATVSYSSLILGGAGVTIHNLPFDADPDPDTTHYLHPCNTDCIKLNRTTNTQVYCNVEPDTDYFRIQYQVEGTTSGSSAKVPPANFDSSGTIVVSGWYITDE